MYSSPFFVISKIRKEKYCKNLGMDPRGGYVYHKCQTLVLDTGIPWLLYT